MTVTKGCGRKRSCPTLVDQPSDRLPRGRPQRTFLPYSCFSVRCLKPYLLKHELVAQCLAILRESPWNHHIRVLTVSYCLS